MVSSFFHSSSFIVSSSSLYILLFLPLFFPTFLLLFYHHHHQMAHKRISTSTRFSFMSLEIFHLKFNKTTLIIISSTFIFSDLTMLMKVTLEGLSFLTTLIKKVLEPRQEQAKGSVSNIGNNFLLHSKFSLKG